MPTVEEKLQTFLNEYIPGDTGLDSEKFRKQALAEIRSTGKISDQTYSQIGASQQSKDEINKQLASILPQDKAGIKSQLGDQPVDPNTLTDSELQSRIDSLQAGTTAKGRIDPAQLAIEINTKLQEYGRDPGGSKDQPGGVDPLAKQIADLAIQLGSYPDANQLRDLWAKNYHQSGQTLPQYLNNFFNDQNARNDLSTFIENQTKPGDYSTELKALQDVAKSRGIELKSMQDQTAYNAGLQGELAKGTEQFIQSQTEAENQRFQTQTAPDIAQTLNQKGLLFGGDLPSELLSAAAEMQGGLEQIHASLLASDLSFWQNAGYQYQLQQVIKSGGDVTSALQQQQQTALDLQQQRFSGSEAALNRTAQSEMQRRQAEQNLKTQQADLQRNQDLVNKQNQQALATGAATAAGQIAGSTIAAHSKVGLSG